ncbi:MAG: isoprenylcysteine carboxylmethyltransferase family protein [Thermoanaerobaculia bacterium]
MTTYRKYLKPAVWGFYIVIGFEFLFMISPFALYFYSSYGNVLNFLHRWPATAWLTGFFLPHVSMTTSPVLESLKPWGFRLAGLGLLLFLIGIVQIYGAKLFRRQEVTGGLYRISRHPQYLALAILGLGVLLIWPRFLVLVAFVTMLFLYCWLARWEESQCLEKYGDSYREYMEEVGWPGPAWLTSWIPPAPAWSRRPAAVLGLYLLTLVVAVAAGRGLRDYSLTQVSSYYTDEAAVLSPAILDEEELREGYELVRSDDRVREQLKAASREDGALGGWLVYVVPVSWYLPDLPMDSWHEIPPEHQGGHTTPSDFEPGKYKVLFTKARTHHPESQGVDIVKTAYGREPMLRARVDLGRGELTSIETPPASVVWGDIPTPLY